MAKQKPQGGSKRGPVTPTRDGNNLPSKQTGHVSGDGRGNAPPRKGK
jgi:hypothetical protein